MFLIYHPTLLEIFSKLLDADGQFVCAKKLTPIHMQAHSLVVDTNHNLCTRSPFI